MEIISTREIRGASIKLAALGEQAKNGALAQIAQGLLANKDKIASVNAVDVERAERDGLPTPMVKRLKMDARKVEGAAKGIHSLIELADPVGKTLFENELDDGFVLRKITCPIGVIGIIFESRPDALVQIASLCLKSGNAVILKGGSEAAGTNRVLCEIIKKASDSAGLPGHWITQLETRAEINEILGMDRDIDLLIPRGSYAFVRYIMDNSRIPVIGHSEGLCHCYVDASADIGRAVRIAEDSKTQYAAVCNAAETLLVHREAAPAFLPALWDALNGAGGTSGNACVDNTPGGVGDGGGDSNNTSNAKPYVTIRGCAETRRILANRPVEEASEDDWGAEYLDYIISVKIVGSVGEAIDHINKYGSRHTDAIVTEDAEAARQFALYVDSANVFHNCSTRFSDGFRYGFGAEVGVSTSKIHARGPVGLDGLVTYKYLLSGTGNIVADYERGKRTFTHTRPAKS